MLLKMQILIAEIRIDLLRQLVNIQLRMILHQTLRNRRPHVRKSPQELYNTFLRMKTDRQNLNLIFPQITGLHGLLHTVFGLELRDRIFSIQVIQLLSCPPAHAGKQIAAQKVQHVMPGNKHARDQRTLCTFILFPVHRMVQILSIKLDRHADAKLRRSSPGKTNLVISRHQTYFTSYPFVGFLSEQFNNSTSHMFHECRSFPFSLFDPSTSFFTAFTSLLYHEMPHISSIFYYISYI